MEFDELKALMRDSGIVGAGGAGFPSYAKMNKNADTLIINCAECEPLLRLHRQLLEKRPFEILTAVDFIAKAIGAKDVVIGLKKAYTKAIQAVSTYLPEFENIRICLLKEVYPAGDEVVLIYEATGRLVPPGRLPIEAGVIVYNVETVYNVYRALNGIPVVRKYVTIGGEVKNPQTVYVPVGTEFSELAALAGGCTVDSPAFLVGGPMMGKIGNEYDVVTKTTNAVIVLPEDHYVIRRKKTKASIDLKRAMAACCQCHYCTDMCPRHLLGHPIDPAGLMRVASNHDTGNIAPYLNAFFCSGCGLCEMYSCGQGLSPRNLLQDVKAKLRAEGVRAPEAPVPVPVKNRELRRVPVLRLAARLDLTKYNHTAPMVSDEISPRRVRILTSQHAGLPAVPVVKPGDHVEEHSLIAGAAEGLSVPVHASITGVVTEVNRHFICIERESGK